MNRNKEMEAIIERLQASDLKTKSNLAEFST